MRLSSVGSQVALASTATAIPQLYDVSSSTTALTGTGNDSDATVLGNYYTTTGPSRTTKQPTI